MIYGYALKELDDGPGLLEMKEVTFSAEPSVLREIGNFLIAMSRQMDAGGFAKTSHRHIGDVIPDWDGRFPNKDIIVAAPRPYFDIDKLPRVGPFPT
jgi:hypothetical protein